MCPINNHNNSEIENRSGSNSVALANKTSNEFVLMQTLKIRLKNGNKEMLIRCLIDTGSQKSYLIKNSIKRLGYSPIGQETLNHGLFGGVQKTHQHKKYKIFVSNMQENYSCNFEVYDQDKICADVPTIKDGPWVKEAANCGIYFSDYERTWGSRRENRNTEIHLLIGADICGKLFTGNIKSLPSGLTAIETRLGWTIMGKTHQFQRSDSTNIVLSLHVTEAKITDLWRLDTLGILDPGEQGNRKELELAAVEHFNRNLKVVEGGRYEVRLPWIEGHPPLPNYRNVAERRLKSCVGSLRKSDNLESYEAVFQEWLQDNIIEEISPSPNGKNDHFLPHRAVVKENSTTRIRPVFDGSTRDNSNPSINDCLEKGPNLVELIPSVINKFRLNKIGVISDIKRAFLQIQLSERDRSFLKFLWWENGDPTKLKCFQHRRIVFGLNCSPYILGATLQYHLGQAPEYMKKTAVKLAESFYIDNCITSVNNEKDLEIFIKEAKLIMSTANFDLRGWEHNTPSLSLENNVAKKVPVLGLSWELSTDSLSIDLKENAASNESITKREILSTVHKVFDPIGYSCPVTLRPKIMLQDCWSQKITWDSQVPPSIAKKFTKWKRQLPLLQEINIPRCLIEYPDALADLSLHVFSDASKLAYATCIFLRSSTEEHFISCQLVQARSRVAPLKAITIPRLELLACTIGARLAHNIRSDLKLENIQTYYWTDSANALFWIKKHENWAPFVYNRVQEIRSLSKPEEWNFVPGPLNPADLPSRGCSAEYLKQSRWWEGPEWLRNPQERWPKGEIKPDREIIDSEKRKTIVTTTNIAAEPFALFEKSSSYTKMIRITAWIYRFFENLKKKQGDRNLQSTLNFEEINFAELIVLRYAQKSLINENKPCYTNLETFIDDKGIIRIKTRIVMRKDLHAFRFPIVLPCDQNIVFLLIRKKHLELHHAGIQILMSVLREQYWIIRCRRTVRKIIKNCVTCRRFTASPIVTPNAPLPEERVRDANVFEIVGLDLCGPLFLKNGSKVWVVLITCAVFRAIHVELVSSLTTENFLLALRRFIARRGRPSTIFSDNGTNFVKASSELKSINFEALKNFAFSKKINWKFNPPSAPWWGGFFERMIGMLKNILRRVLGRASLHYEELYTVLCDAESVINSRPLTYVSDDDHFVPLTPAMFLQDVVDSRVPDLDAIDATRMRKRFAYRQKVREDLRKRFRNEYLGQIKNFEKTKRESQIKKGDIVLIGDNNSKRINWPLAKIETLYPGKDGHIRVASVQTKSGTLLRPLKKLYSLEITDTNIFPFLVDRAAVPISEVRSPVPVPVDPGDDGAADPTYGGKSPEPAIPADVPIDGTSAKDVNRLPTSRAGRPLKKPQRLQYEKN